MPINPKIGGDGPSDFPALPSAIAVYVRNSFEEGTSWELDESLELVAGKLCSAGHGRSSATIFRRFGLVQQPFESSAYKVLRKTSEDMVGKWIQLRFIYLVDGEDVENVQWIGRIENASTTLCGNQAEMLGFKNVPTGTQFWTAYSGLEYLDKLEIYESWHGAVVVTPDTDSDPEFRESLIDWIPPMNRRDKLNMLVGNRTVSKHANLSEPDDEESGEFSLSYIYGSDDGTSGVWTHRQYIEYILARFVNSLVDKPRFVLVDDTGALESLENSIDFGNKISIGDILRALLNIKFGVDFVVRPSIENPEYTYEIYVFALSADDHTFGDEDDEVTLPKNVDLVDIDPGATAGTLIMPPEVIDSREHQYEKIVVLGRRAVCMFTLRGDEGFDGPSDDLKTLVKKWSDTLETAYKAADDDARRNEKYAAVYQIFGAPEKWDHLRGYLNPVVLNDGSLLEFEGDEGDDDPKPAFQNAVRETLPWIPLRKGYDYSVSPVTNSNPSDVEADFRPPVVWLYDEEKAKYFNVEEYEIAVHALRNEWGVFLNPNPNHRLGLNHFSETSESEPEFDWEKLVVTIAIHTDQRFSLRHSLSPMIPDAGNEQSVKIIELNDAELWFAAPGTIVGVDDDGDLVAIHESNRILRNDTDRLRMAMAGAIARYTVARRRCRVSIRENVAYATLIGKILKTYTSTSSSGGEGGTVTDTETIDAPVTAIEWTAGQQRTTIIQAGLTL